MKKILLITIILLNINLTFADEKKANWILFYEQCNSLLEKTERQNIAKLWNNLCIFIETNNSEFTTILAKKENDFWLELIKPEILKYLKKNYYRWEKINIYHTGYRKNITQKLNFNKNIIKNYDSFISDYQIIFFEDVLLSEFHILKKYCTFNSYHPKCSNKSKKEIIERVEELLENKLVNTNKLLNYPKNILSIERNKINNIKNKIKALEKLYSKKAIPSDNTVYLDNTLFIIKYLIYKFEIYDKIIGNRISDLNFLIFLKENNIYFIDKELIWDLFISQNNQFTFFYYENKRINTLKNSLSHFDEDELKADPKLLKKDSEYLKEKIRNKYSAKFIENTNKKLILITKTYLSRKKYLIFNTETYEIEEYKWETK